MCPSVHTHTHTHAHTHAHTHTHTHTITLNFTIKHNHKVADLWYWHFGFSLCDFYVHVGHVLAGGGGGGGGGSGKADAAKMAGVPVDGLPGPAPLKPAVAKDFGREISIFGEYVMQCFHSTTWTLREAALKKIEVDLETYSVSKVCVTGDIMRRWHRSFSSTGTVDGVSVVFSRAPFHFVPCFPMSALTSQSELLAACCTVIGFVLEKEKIAQVILYSLTLLPAVVGACASDMRRPDLHSGLENVLNSLLFKLGDTNARTLNAAVQAFMDLAAMECIGPNFVGSFLVRKLPKKQASAWKPLKVTASVFPVGVGTFFRVILG
jgi:hypothetical protein